MTEPTPPSGSGDAVGPRTVEHPIDRRRRTAVGVSALLVIGAIFAAGGAVPTAMERANAVAAYTAAVATESGAERTLRAASQRLDAAQAQVQSVADLLDPIIALSGEPIPESAAAALRTSQDAALAAMQSGEAAVYSAQMPGMPPDGMSVPELRAETARRIAEEAAVQSLAAVSSARADDAGAAASSLGTALGAYLAAVQARGEQYVEAAGKRYLTIGGGRALRQLVSALAALTDAPTESLPRILKSAVTAVATLGFRLP